jgi:glucokinase
MNYAIGIDLGGTRIKAISVTEERDCLSKLQADFAPGAPMNWSEEIRGMTHQLQRERGLPARWIGISAPGLAAVDGRSIAFMPGRLHGLEGLDWTQFLNAPEPIPVLNDAHAALLGEWWCGAARGFQHAILLTLGTGVGGAVLSDGKLLRGAIGRAGHLGHACLDPAGVPDITGIPGSLEDAIGNCTISRRTGGRFQTTHDLVAAHLAGDSQATEVWLKSVRDLACAIASFINILDPEAVIVGGGIARAGRALFEPLEKFLEPIEWRPGGHRARIIPASLGEFAGAFGAAANAIESSAEIA